MLPGPIMIYKCPDCLNSIKQYTFTSGNTFGATFWSDGRCIGPMVSPHAWLVLCPHCHARLWIDELENVGKMSIWMDKMENVGKMRLTQEKEDQFLDSELSTVYPLWWLTLKKEDQFLDSRGYEIPALSDYYALIEQGLDDPEKERYIRIQIWWAGNDLRRDESAECPMSRLEVENLERLVEILDESPAGNLVMKADAMRALGRMNESRALLDKVDGDQCSSAVTFIRGLLEVGDTLVREIPSEWPKPKSRQKQRKQTP